MTKDSIRRCLHIAGWRLRYSLLDTPTGRHVCLGLALVFAVVGAWQFYAGVQASAVGAPRQAIWVQIVVAIVAALISYALIPKQPDAVDQVTEAPRLEDGAGVRMVFGEVWITDPAVIGWRKMGTKTIRGKKSGFNGRPIIGYWYKQLFHFVLCRGPVDAVLEFRGGDKTAWKGELTRTDEVHINQRDLWGGQGTGGEGGIEGPLQFLFGDASQAPSAYLASVLGPLQPAYRGLLTAMFKGGLWGAFSPYPKAASFKVRRVLDGWERAEGAWYPEKALVVVDPGLLLTADLKFSATSAGVGSYAGITFSEGFSADDTIIVEKPAGLAYAAYSFWNADDNPDADGKAWTNAFWVTNSLGETSEYWGAVPGEAGDERYATAMEAEAAVGLRRVVLRGSESYTFWINDTPPDDNRGGLSLRIYKNGQFSMNPAHMLYQSITDSWMGAEPETGISEVSFRAAADALYAEGFGLCTEWDSTTESVEQFQQRICDVIGANLSRSPVDGLWYLDLIRGGYDAASLPVLTDDDIIEYTEQPGTMQDAVNQVIVEWRDPQRREDRSTAPVQSLGAIQAVGAVVGEVATYREIPLESLALRVAGRNLQSKSQPLRRNSLKVTRIAYAWRPGQVFRLQSAKRGVADMICRVGDSDRGTLRSGAIALTVLQDVFGLPQSVYVTPDPGTGPGDDDLPVPVASSLVLEAPYALLSGLLPPGELSALPVASGYVFAVATPAGTEIDYSLLVDGPAGFVDQAESDWSATAVNVLAVGRTESVIEITAARHFDEVTVGAMVLWGAEVCRLDALDIISGTVTLGRGCGDTVPSAHVAGERIWVIDDSIALDANRYSAGTVLAAKLLPRSSSQRLALGDAEMATVALDSRAARPYPPAAATLNGSSAPVELFETVVVAWRHRDRITSAGQLIDQAAASIGPETGTTYTVRWYLDGVLDHTLSGIPGTTASYAPAIDGLLRVELEAVRDGLSSWQMQVFECTYRVTHYSDYADGIGDIYADQAGDTYNG